MRSQALKVSSCQGSFRQVGTAAWCALQFRNLMSCALLGPEGQQHSGGYGGIVGSSRVIQDQGAAGMGGTCSRAASGRAEL